MKRLIAIVLGIALLSPTPVQANANTYQLLTPVLTTTYELPAQTYTSRWRAIEIPFSVVLISDGSASVFHFDLIDAEGFKIATNENVNPNNFKITTMKDPITWTQTNKWTLHSFDKAKLPITLRTTIEFWRSEGKPDIVQTFPMNFVTHKDDVAVEAAAADLKAKQDAEAKAAADKAAADKAAADAKPKTPIQFSATRSGFSVVYNVADTYDPETKFDISISPILNPALPPTSPFSYYGPAVWKTVSTTSFTISNSDLNSYFDGIILPYAKYKSFVLIKVRATNILGSSEWSTGIYSPVSDFGIIDTSAAELKAKQEVDAKAAADLLAKQKAAAAKALANKKTTITCIKGKTVKKVTAIKPVCPKGYKKK